MFMFIFQKYCDKNPDGSQMNESQYAKKYVIYFWFRVKKKVLFTLIISAYSACNSHDPWSMRLVGCALHVPVL